MRRAARTDENQQKIVEQLRRCGYSVHPTHALGKGFPDIVVGCKGKGNFLFEIKDPAQPPSKRRLTEDEAKFFGSWKGQVSVIETIEDALRIIDKNNTL